ncbi:MAG: PadR family transcriptional regulator [Actinobacteria bacterium]|nr:PadR family transcriptional regulator [Actinomycetota bacterium]
MTSPRSTTSHALLGLLAIRPWTTYELAKQVQRSLDWFWPRAERKLYDEPKKLAEDGLVKSEKEMTGARPRTVYGITRKGRDAQRKWLSEPPMPPSLEFEGMVKVFFADGGTLEQLRATLRSIAETAEEHVTDLEEKIGTLGVSDAFPERRHLNAIGLRFHVDHERHLAQWARWAIEQTKSWKSTTDAGAWDFHQAFG